MKTSHHHLRRHRVKIGSAGEAHDDPIFARHLAVRCDPQQKQTPMNSLTESIPATPAAANNAPTPTAKAGDRIPQIQQTRAVGERTSESQKFEINQQQKE